MTTIPTRISPRENWYLVPTLPPTPPTTQRPRRAPMQPYHGGPRKFQRPEKFTAARKPKEKK